MSNVIRFEIETEANYTASEREALLDSFLEFISETDGDVIEGTEDLKIIDINIAGNVQSVEEKVQEAMESTGLVGVISLQDSDGKVLRKLSFSEFSVEG